jgi:hypothetical protein
MTADNKNLTDKIRLILIIRCYIRPDFNDRIKFSTFIIRLGGLVEVVVNEWETNKRMVGSAASINNSQFTIHN